MIAQMKESRNMANEKENMIHEIEQARERLNASIDNKEAYGRIYQCSVELDRLLDRYVRAGY